VRLTLLVGTVAAAGVGMSTHLYPEVAVDLMRA
jgi:hypothetical protein